MEIKSQTIMIWWNEFLSYSWDNYIIIDIIIIYAYNKKQSNNK